MGRWFVKGRVWICVTDNDLIVCAAGRKPFIEKVSLHDVADSFYNAITGELVFQPADVFSLKKVGIAPHDAHTVISAARFKGRGGG